MALLDPNDLIVQQEYSGLGRFLFPQPPKPTQEIEILLLRKINSFFSFFAKGNVSLQTMEHWASRKPKTIFLSIVEYCHRTNAS